MRPGTQDSASPRTMNLSQVVTSVFFHFRIVNYTSSLDLDTFPEIFRSAIIGNYDCEKGLLYKQLQKAFRSCTYRNSKNNYRCN